MELAAQIAAYIPFNEQEAHDKDLLLGWLNSGTDIYTRENAAAHLTASAWVVSPDRQQVLMVYHNIYQSWSWMGGHADGERDLLGVARQEVLEESGLKELKLLSPDIFSLEILTVDGHIKRGVYVPSHIHMNVTYLLQAEEETLRCKRDENSGVQWMTPQEALASSTEPWMVERIYRKLVDKAKAYMA